MPKRLKAPPSEVKTVTYGGVELVYPSEILRVSEIATNVLNYQQVLHAEGELEAYNHVRQLLDLPTFDSPLNAAAPEAEVTEEGSGDGQEVAGDEAEADDDGADKATG